MNNTRNKILGIELLKFIAALMITNSHLKLFYVAPYTPLGTFGAPGNALFFFISGLTLAYGEKSTFPVWYKKRIKRIWPSIIVWSTFLGPLLINSTTSLESVWLAKDYWFIQCIMIYYILYWMIFKYVQKERTLYIITLMGLIASIGYFLLSPITTQSIYQTQFHFICFFSIFIMGGIIGSNPLQYSIKKNNNSRNLILCVISFILFYVPQIIGKGENGFLYYIQILSIFPLHSFIYYLYNLSNSKFSLYLVTNKYTGYIIRAIGALTLEIYIVGFTVFFIPLEINKIFPLNIPLIFICIFVLAYTLKILSKIFIQTFSSQAYSLKEIIKL